jgi:hypothetical protein
MRCCLIDTPNNLGHLHTCIPLGLLFNLQMHSCNWWVDDDEPMQGSLSKCVQALPKLQPGLGSCYNAYCTTCRLHGIK